MSRNTFAVAFFIKTLKTNKKGEAPIYGRITVNGERAEFSANRRILPKKWDRGQVKGKTTEFKAIQNHLDTLRQRVFSVHTQLVDQGKPISAKILKNSIQLTPKKGKSLMEAFEYRQKQLLELGKVGTRKKYITIQAHVKAFLKHQHRMSDIPLNELKLQFIKEFVHYLKTEGKISHNTARRYMKQLKAIAQISEDNEWIEKNPFRSFRMRHKETDKVLLTETELKQIEDKEIEIERLSEVKGVFLFACYTGLAYVDLEKLTPSEIQTLEDGQKMIITRRKKTEVKSTIFLQKKALALIKKYENHPFCESSGKVLPVKSNQKYNGYLKEIQVLCEIDKLLTSHVARRTYATYLLNNGIPLEIVQKSLGHTRIEQTQKYAKLLTKTVADVVGKLDEKN